MTGGINPFPHPFKDDKNRPNGEVKTWLSYLKLSHRIDWIGIALEALDVFCIPFEKNLSLKIYLRLTEATLQSPMPDHRIRRWSLIYRPADTSSHVESWHRTLKRVALGGKNLRLLHSIEYPEEDLLDQV